MTTLEITFLIIYLMFFGFFLVGLIKLSIDYKKYSKKYFHAQVTSYLVLIAMLIGLIAYIVYGS
ncbi:hypothetical protein [Succinivibrio sp.]|uniref:hypothetical protein n=1 Tax=Succinivibrio sp. TaxID=2053619 RepID=UPI00258CC7B2|nr:hypothetical protein [Succinivibrio sp.]MDD6205728.1 hypothetical protein [Succinivibrio sp.]